MIDSRDEDQMTPMGHAAERGAKDVVQYFFEYGEQVAQFKQFFVVFCGVLTRPFSLTLIVFIFPPFMINYVYVHYNSFKACLFGRLSVCLRVRLLVCWCFCFTSSPAET